MSKPKRQHWVPRFYLNYFATPETKHTQKPLIWIFSNDSGDPKLTSTRAIAAQKHLYSPRDKNGVRSWAAEEQLADLEALMSRVWSQFAEPEFLDICGDKPLRELLAVFVAVLHLRHPRRLTATSDLHTQMVDFYTSLPTDSNGRPDLSEVEMKGVSQPLDNTGWQEYRTANSDDIQHMFVDALLSSASYCAEILLRKRWSVVYSNDPVFITTDTPVELGHQTKGTYGIGTPGTLVSFPLSPTRILVMDDCYGRPDGHYYPLGDLGPGEVNLLAWRNCDRFMFSSRPTDQVCAEMLASRDRTLGG